MKNNRMEEKACRTVSYGQKGLCVQIEERAEFRTEEKQVHRHTFTDNLFTAGEVQLYSSVIQPFVAANGTQRKTKTSKEQDRVSERERETGEDSGEKLW